MQRFGTDHQTTGNQSLYKSLLNHSPRQGKMSRCANQRYDKQNYPLGECHGDLKYKDNEHGYHWYICGDCGAWQVRTIKM